jgi:hypothetical protein
MADVTKLVANRVGNSRSVAAALDVQVAKSAEKIEEMLFGDAAPKKLSVAEFVALCARALDRVSQNMSESEQQLVQEQADDPLVRASRDEALAALRTEFAEIGASIEGAYGDGLRGHYQLSGPLPSTAELALAAAKATLGALKKGAPSDAPREGRSVDFRALARLLETRVDALSDALTAVKREDKEAQQALLARDNAIAEFEPIYSGVANITVGLLELTGQTALAERVKPTVRRRAGLDAPPAEPTTDPSAPDAGAPGSGTEPR